MQRCQVSFFKRIFSSHLMLMAVCCMALLMSSGYAQAFNISGRVTDSAGVGVANVKIESTGSVNDGVFTDAQGFYTLTGAAAGTYIITPEFDSGDNDGDDDDDGDDNSGPGGGDSRDDSDDSDDDDNGTFSPATRTVTVTNANVTGVNFTFIRNGGGSGTGAFTISGRVTNSAGVGVAGVRIESTGSVNDNVLTNAQGLYTLTGAAPGSYIITPEIDGVDERFEPATRTVRVINSNVTGVNFTSLGNGPGNGGGFTISGRVVNSAGAGVPNVRVESTGSVNDNVLTNAQGFYTLTGAAPGTYIITPEIDGVDETFSPATRTVTVGNSNVTGVNFTLVRGGGGPGTGAFTISGRVVNSAGVGVANVRIESTGEVTDNILTNAQGFYTLRGVAPGTYVITPEIDGVDETFSPATRTVTVSNSNVAGVNFTLVSGGGPGVSVFTISGRVVNAAGQGIANVKIESTGDVNDGVFTNAQGFYTLTGATPGAYIITPERGDTRFAPRTRTVRVTTANVTNVNFTATRLFNIIVRAVTSSGVPIPDVRIESTGDVVDGVVTNPGGIAILRGAAPGNYTISAQLAGFRFEPTSQVVTVRDRNIVIRFIGIGQTTALP